MHSDYKESIRPFCEMANNKRMEKKQSSRTNLKAAVDAIDG